MDTAQWLRNSQCPSVVVSDTCWGCDVPFEDLIAAIGGPPTHPSSDSTSPYWDELLEVVQTQMARQRGDLPSSVMPLPALWKNYTIDQVANAVHNEVRATAHDDRHIIMLWKRLVLTVHFRNSQSLVSRQYSCQSHYISTTGWGYGR